MKMTHTFLEDIADRRLNIIEVYPNDYSHGVTLVGDVSIYKTLVDILLQIGIL